MYFRSSNRLLSQMPLKSLLNPLRLRGLSSTVQQQQHQKQVFKLGVMLKNKPKSPPKEKIMDFFHVLISGTLIISSVSILGYFILLVASGVVKRQRIQYLVKEGIITLNDGTNQESNSSSAEQNTNK